MDLRQHQDDQKYKEKRRTSLKTWKNAGRVTGRGGGGRRGGGRGGKALKGVKGKNKSPEESESESDSVGTCFYLFLHPNSMCFSL